MNAKRKKQLSRAAGMLSDARSIIDEVREDEEGAFDARSDAWKESGNGEKAAEDLFALQDIVTALEDAEERLEEISQ